jgi:hypothetical protein
MSKKQDLPIKTRERGKKELFGNLSDRSDFVHVNANLIEQTPPSPSNIETALSSQSKESEGNSLSIIMSGVHSPDIIKKASSNPERENIATQQPISNAQPGLTETSDSNQEKLWNKAEKGQSEIESNYGETYLPDRTKRGRKPGPISRKEQIKIYEEKRSRTLQKIGPRLPADKVRILKAYCATQEVDLEDVIEEALDLWSTGKVKDPETGQFVNWWSQRAMTEPEKYRNG